MNPTILSSEDKEDSKAIDMDLLMLGLKIEKGDIVVVGNVSLIRTENGDLVNFPRMNYSADVPNLIIGMVSGKHTYKIYKVTNIKEMK